MFEKITPETYEKMNEEFEEERSCLPNHCFYSERLMTGDNVTKLNITKNLVEKIAELLNAEVHYSYLLNL